MTESYDHYSLVPDDAWTWPHFSPREMACPHCDELKYLPGFMDRLEAVRLLYGGPIAIASAYRCEDHNAAVGGRSNSAHLRGAACDPKDPGDGARRKALLDAIYRAGFTGFGMGAGKLHIDYDPSLRERAWFYGA